MDLAARETKTRVGRNEAFFRAVNERLEGLNETFAELSDDRFQIVCECGEQSCIDQIELMPGEYEAVRSDSALFAVKPGHEVEDVETVVERKDGYWVVRKAPGAPQRIARETDPRN